MSEGPPKRGGFFVINKTNYEQIMKIMKTIYHYAPGRAHNEIKVDKLYEDGNGSFVGVGINNKLSCRV